MFSFLKKIQWHHICLFFIAYLLFIRFLLIFSFSIDLDGNEFAFIHNVQLQYQGVSLYRNPDAFPFYAVMYMPLYYYTLLALTNLLGVNPVFEIHKVLIIARGVNFIMIFICLRMLYKLMLDFNLKKQVIYFFLLLFVLLINGHFYAARPDGIKIALFVIQLYCILRYFYLDIKHKKYLFLLVACNALAFLLKQDSIVYSNLLLFVLLLSKRNKASLMLFAGCLLLLFFVYFVCTMSFGENFYTNTFIYNFQTITNFKDSYNLTVLIMSVLRLSVLSIICIYYFLTQRNKISTSSIEFFLGIAAIVLFIFAHILMLKSGGNINYSYEFIVIVILLTACVFYRMLVNETIRNRIKYIFGFYFLLLFITNLLLGNYVLNNSLKENEKTDYEKKYATAVKIKEVIKDDIFFFPDASNVLFYSDCRNLFYGYEAHISRFINLHYQQNTESKLLFVSPKNVDDSFKNGFVKYIIIHNDASSAKHVVKYYPNYYTYTNVEDFVIYKYNDIHLNNSKN